MIEKARAAIRSATIDAAAKFQEAAAAVLSPELLAEVRATAEADEERA